MRLPATFIQLAFFFLLKYRYQILYLAFLNHTSFFVILIFLKLLKRSKITDIVDNPPQHSLHSP